MGRLLSTRRRQETRPGGCCRRTIRLRMTQVRRRPLPHQRPRRRPPLLQSGLLAHRHSPRQTARSGSFSASAGANLAQTEAAERPTALWAGTMPTTASLSAILGRRALQTGRASHVRRTLRRAQWGKRGGHALIRTLLGLACHAIMLRGVLSTASLPQTLQSEAPPPSNSVLCVLPCSSIPSPPALLNFFLFFFQMQLGVPPRAPSRRRTVQPVPNRSMRHRRLQVWMHCRWQGWKLLPLHRKAEARYLLFGWIPLRPRQLRVVLLLDG